MPSEKPRDARPRVRRVPVAMPATAGGQPGFLRNLRFSTLGLVLIGVIVLFVVVLAPSLRTLIQQQEQIAQKQEQVASQKADVAAKRKDVARWDDPAYIEAQARDRLLYVYPGEESYLVMGATTGTSSSASSTPTTDSGTPVSTTVQTPKVDWVQAMLSSVMKSGLSDQTSQKLVAPDVSGSGQTK